MALEGEPACINSLYYSHSIQKREDTYSNLHKNIINFSATSRNHYLTNVNKTNDPSRNESAEGDNPQLDAMKEVIKCLTNAVSRLERNQATTPPLVDIEVKSEKKLGNLPPEEVCTSQ